MSAAGFELPDRSNGLLHTDALDRKDAGIINKINIRCGNECIKHYNGDILVILKDKFQF